MSYAGLPKEIYPIDIQRVIRVVLKVTEVLL